MKRLLRNPWLWTFLLGVLLLTLIRPLLQRVPEPPPILGRLPAFSLVDSEGKPFGLEDLRGRAAVVSFFFTRCASICPLIQRSMHRLQDEIEKNGTGGIRLLSISVDPGHDTPERLRAYATELGVHGERWTLLTGEDEAIRRLVVEGFKVPMGDALPGTSPGLFEIAHTGKLVLIDAEGAIRGYYDTDELGLEEVYSRARQVR